MRLLLLLLVVVLLLLAAEAVIATAVVVACFSISDELAGLSLGSIIALDQLAELFHGPVLEKKKSQTQTWADTEFEHQPGFETTTTLIGGRVNRLGHGANFQTRRVAGCS